MSDEKVINAYLENNSIRTTAKEFCLSPQKVRRILINSGIYKTDISLVIRDAYADGQSIEKIAEALKITVKAVNSYLPYAHGDYDGNSRTTKWRRKPSL